MRAINIVLASLFFLFPFSEKTYAQISTDVDTLFRKIAQKIHTIDYWYNLETVSDLVYFLESSTYLQDSLLRETVRNNPELFKIRRNDRNGVDVFVNDKYYVSAVYPFMCVGLSQLGDNMNGDLIIKRMDAYRVSLSHNQEFEKKIDREFRDLRRDLENDTSLTFDISMTRKWGRIPSHFSNPRSWDATMTMRWHPWVFDKEKGVRRTCDCKNGTCNKQIEGMNRILNEVCDSIGPCRIWFIWPNYIERKQSDFADLYINRFPKLHLPCVIVNGDVVSQYCAVGDTAKSSWREYFPEVYVGAFELDDLYVTLKKKSAEKKYILETFDKQGLNIANMEIEDENDKINYVILGDGRLLDLNTNTYHIISPKGRIVPYDKPIMF